MEAKYGGVADESDIGVDLALKELPHQRQLPAFHAVPHHVAHQHAAERRRQLGRKIANLIGVGKNRQERIRFCDELPQRRSYSRPACTARAARAPPRKRLSNCFAGQFARQRRDSLADIAASTGCPSSLPICCAAATVSQRHAVPGPVPLFGDHQDAHMTRASNFSFSTSLAAASFGGPSKICACLARSGT